MKKKIVILLLFVCLVACLGACTKRDKLTNNTMVLQIEPAESITLGIGDTYDLKAIVKNIKMEDIDESVRWSVNPSNIGSFSAAGSKNTVFTAETTGVGTIMLSCQGVTVSVDVTVG